MYDDLRAAFGFTNGQLGALSTAFFVVHAAATMPLAWAADRFDRRKVIAVGVVLWSLATLGSAYALGFASMFFLRGMVGIGEAAYGPASITILCEVDPAKKARLNAIYNGGMFAGACAGLWLGAVLGFPFGFEVVAIPGFVLGVMALLLRVPPTRVDLDPSAPRPTFRRFVGQMVEGMKRTLGIPTLRWMLVSATLISFAAGGYVSWIVDFTVQVKGMTAEVAAPFYALTALTGGVLGVLSGGWIGDRWQRRTPRGRVLTIALGFLCAFPFCICVMLIDHGLPYYITGWLLMYFIPYYNGPMAAVIDDVVDDDEAATAQATFVLFLHTLGTGSASVIVGYVSEIPGVGMRWAFSLPAAATLLAGLVALYASKFVAADMEAKRVRVAKKVR
jgi:MFS family permease